MNVIGCHAASWKTVLYTQEKGKEKKKDNIIMKVVLTLQVACEWAPQAFPNPSLRSTGLNLCTSAKSFEQQDEEMAHILSKRT